MFTEGTSRTIDGGIVIRSRLGAPAKRQGFERKALFPHIEVGLSGWQRAHSQGAGIGAESPHAIRYAPAEVNQHYQRLGIERHLKELVEHKPANVELWLTTVTFTHPRTLRLKEIQYKVDAIRGPQRRILYEASIEVEDKRDNPRITANATPFALSY